MYELYRYKFYLNSSHLEEKINANMSEIVPMPYTWELSLTVMAIENQFISFDKVDKIVNNLLSLFQNQVLDELPPFEHTKPTIRNVCNYFNDVLKPQLIEIGCLLICLEIAETPARSFIISNVNKKEYYKFKLYLDASHAVLFDGKLGEKHQHCFEVNLSVIDMNEQKSQHLKEIKEQIEEIFAPYQNTYLNELTEFKDINPTLECISAYFKDVLSFKLEQNNYSIFSLEMAETPSRSYILK